MKFIITTTCEVCAGSGKVFTMQSGFHVALVCSKCAGRKTIQRKILGVIDATFSVKRVTVKFKCSTCGGRGYLSHSFSNASTPCSVCKGGIVVETFENVVFVSIAREAMSYE